MHVQTTTAGLFKRFRRVVLAPFGERDEQIHLRELSRRFRPGDIRTADNTYLLHRLPAGPTISFHLLKDVLRLYSIPGKIDGLAPLGRLHRIASVDGINCSAGHITPELIVFRLDFRASYKRDQKDSIINIFKISSHSQLQTPCVLGAQNYDILF